jgi:AraC family transcriptional regulator
MTPIVKIISDKYMIGMKSMTSLSQYNPFQLWHRFMPRRKEILHIVSAELFSLQVYEAPLSFSTFDEHSFFDMWAAVEVSTIEQIPIEMVSHTIKGGHFVTFTQMGSGVSLSDNFKDIYENWLPTSGYTVDDRTHFQVMGEKYKRNDPLSEEEVWIPIVPVS